MQIQFYKSKIRAKAEVLKVNLPKAFWTISFKQDWYDLQSYIYYGWMREDRVGFRSKQNYILPKKRSEYEKENRPAECKYAFKKKRMNGKFTYEESKKDAHGAGNNLFVYGNKKQ